MKKKRRKKKHYLMCMFIELKKKIHAQVCCVNLYEIDFVKNKKQIFYYFVIETLQPKQ